LLVIGVLFNLFLVESIIHNMEKQVEKKHYNFHKYCDEERFVSYWHQLKEILKVVPHSVLEIGVGDKVLESYIKNNTNIEYVCVDIAGDLSPDVVASVIKLPFRDDSFDVVCAFEVLEHLPFEKFVIALQEIRRVARKNVIISLPHWGRHFSFQIRLPYFKKIIWQYKFNFWPIKHVFKGEHYWEIGKDGYGLKKIKNAIITAGLEVKEDYVAFNSPYHHFFILKSIQD